jgi:large subunit ribosomal protein L24
MAQIQKNRKFKIKKGDKVIVLTGKDKGKRGEVIEMLRSEDRAIVSGVNKVKRHTKPSAQGAGGIEEKEAPIHLSNIAIEDPKTGKPTRVGYKIDGDTKVRIAKGSGESING